MKTTNSLVLSLFICGCATSPYFSQECHTDEKQLELVRICSKGDIRTLQAKIAVGADVNEPIEYKGLCGWTPLMEASREGYADIVELLIKRGAQLNARNYFGFTALDVAIFNNNENIIKLLVSNGGERGLIEIQEPRVYEMHVNPPYPPYPEPPRIPTLPEPHFPPVPHMPPTLPEPHFPPVPQPPTLWR